MEDGPVIEFVLYRLKAGVEEAQYLEASDGITNALRTLPGFLSRRLMTAVEDGQWAEVVEWRSMEEAMHAAEIFPTLPEIAPAIELVDMSNVTMLHLAPRRSYVQAQASA
jgi:hypothetical protein